MEILCLPFSIIWAIIAVIIKLFNGESPITIGDSRESVEINENGDVYAYGRYIGEVNTSMGRNYLYERYGDDFDTSPGEYNLERLK